MHLMEKTPISNGKFPGGQRPFGYAFSKELRNIVPDPAQAPIIRKVFADVANEELCIREVSERLASYGHLGRDGTKMAKSAVRKLLSNKHYMGIITWKGETYEGKFTPIISPELFQKVQHVLTKRSKPRKVRYKHDFPFRGLLKCSCRASITAQWGKGHGGTYRYYRCTRKSGDCREPYIQEKNLATQVLDKLSPLGISTPEANEIRALISVQEEAENGTISTAIKQMNFQLFNIQEKIDKLTRAYLDPDQSVDEDSFRNVKQELVIEKTALKAEKDRLQKQRLHHWIEPTRNLISTLETLGNMPVAASPFEIANILRKIGTNPLLANKTVTFSFGENYDFLPSLLACARSAQLVNPAKRHGDLPQNSQSSKWCAQ